MPIRTYVYTVCYMHNMYLVIVFSEREKYNYIIHSYNYLALYVNYLEFINLLNFIDA